MEDGTIRLAARLGRPAGLVHPLDWVRLWESHTPYEWALQVALCQVEPWGDERADLREGRNTVFQIAANRSEPMGDEAFGDLIKVLARYLQTQQEPDKRVGAKALRQALGDA